MHQQPAVSIAEVDKSVLEGRLYIRLKSLLPGYVTARKDTPRICHNGQFCPDKR